MHLSDDDVQQLAEADRREVDPPMQVEGATWSKAGMIDWVRTFIGYREYPKYGMVSRYFGYKQALWEEAERLVQAHVLRETEDIFYLTFSELHDVVHTNRVHDQLIGRRKDRVRSYQARTRVAPVRRDHGARNGGRMPDDPW
jgi:rifampicin phosphotransferase